MFLFFVIFQTLNTPEQHEHKVLLWGVLYAAWRALRKDPSQHEQSGAVKWLSAHLPFKESAQSGRFIERRGDGHAATPLLLALIAIELTDIAFFVFGASQGQPLN